MGDEYIDFCTKFHELKGDTIGERREYLFRLIRKPSLFTSEAQLKSSLQDLKPTTYQQNLFYIDILIYFHRVDELLEIFLQGNVIYTKKILKQRWFLDSILKEKEVDGFVNEFLPLVPYFIKCKLITRASKLWNQEKNDTLFDAVFNRYGLPLAVPILHSCSLSKAEFEIKENDLKLSSKQLLQLYKSSESFLEFYLSHHKKLIDKPYNEKRVISCILRKNPALLLKLIKEGIIDMPRLGKCSSKIMSKFVRNDLLSNIDFYLCFLKKSVVMWTLKADSNFEKLYKQNPETFLKHFPKHLHWNLFLQTNNEKYPDKNLEDTLLGIEYIEQLHPPRDIMWQWAEVNYNRHMGYKWAYRKFLGYFEPSKAFVIVKEKINLTSNIEERCLLIDLMLHSCQRSNDLVVLEDVLKYICFRHRNEDFEFKNTILLKLHNYFDLKKFNENHWKCIDEIIQIMRIQKEYSYNTHKILQEEHMEFLFRSGKDYKKALIDYIDDNKSLYLHLTLKDLSMKKTIYTAVLNILPELSDKYPDDCKKIQINYLDLIIQFNMKYPDYCINIAHFPSYIDMLQNVLSKDTAFDNYDRFLVRLIIQYNFRFPQNGVPLNIDISELIIRIISQARHLCGFNTFFTEIFCKKERTEITNKLLEYYFSSLLENYLDGYIVNWFIMNEPRVLVPYFRNVVYKSVNTAFLKYINVIKHYSHLGFDKIVCEIYKEKLDDAGNKKRLLEVLQQLLSTSDFLDFVKKYIPEQDKFTKENKTCLNINYLRCDVVKLLVKVSEPYQSIPIVLKFCRGDYIRSGLRALYSNFCKTAEQKLSPYIETLSDLPVPLRKHAIFLSCALMNKKYALNLLKVVNESDISIQKCYFSASLKLFLKHPSQKYLDEILEEIGSVNSLDRKLVYTLTKIKVPLKYRILYVEHCWTFFEGLEKAWELNIKKYLEKILRQVHVDLLRSLSDNFIMHVIKNYFTKNDKHQPSSFYKFLVQILHYRPERRIPIMDIIFSSQSNIPTQPQIQFFEFICNYMRTNDSDTQLVQLLLQHWTKFDILDSYDQYVSLKLIELKMNNPTMDQFAVVVIDLLEQFMSQFGPQIYPMFEIELSRVMDQMIKNDDQRLSFCLEALRYRIDSTVCILIIHLIRQINTENKQQIVKELKNIEIPIVQVYLNQPLTS